jgi:hypothetical protein
MSYIALPNIPNYELGASDPNCKVPLIATEEALLEIPKAKIYPNPTSGYLTVLYRATYGKHFTFRLFDTQGREVFLYQLEDERTSLNLPSSLPKGIYFWHIANGVEVLQQGKLVLLE